MSRPWMPLYVADLTLDTMHLTAAELGGYVRLIAHYWAKGGLPDDLAMLQRICSMGTREWEDCRPIIAAFFEIIDGKWIHKRIEKELQLADNKYEKRAKAGQKGGLSKASNARSNATSNAVAKSYQPQPQSDIKEKINKKEKPSNARAKIFKHELPEGWHPDEKDLAYGKKLGLLNGHFDGQVEALRLWAKANKILKVDWHATLQGFLRRDAEKRGVIAPSNGHESTIDPYAAQVAYWRQEGVSEERIKELKARLNG